MLTMHLFKSKRKTSDFWKSLAFYPPCSDPIFWWSSCRFCAVELFGEAGPGSDSKLSWKWESLPPCGVFWCKQQGKKKRKRKSLCSSMLYQDNCRGKCYTREFSCLKCISVDVQYKLLSIFMQKIINRKLKKKGAAQRAAGSLSLVRGKGIKNLDMSSPMYGWKRVFY